MWLLEMKSNEQGFVLVIALIVSAVILGLVMGNAKTILIDTKLINLYKTKSQNQYTHERTLSHIINKIKEDEIIHCLEEENGADYYFNHFAMTKNSWCITKNNELIDYYLIEKLKTTCCERILRAGNEFSSDRFRINIYSEEGAFKSQIVFNRISSKKTCRCDKPFAINDGIQSYRWSNG
jgi:hypothetical protein